MLQWMCCLVGNPAQILTSVVLLESTLRYLLGTMAEGTQNCKFLNKTSRKYTRREFHMLRNMLSTHLRIKSLAFSEVGTSGGNIRVSFQFITFLYVSCGVSEQNGGYPEEFKTHTHTHMVRSLRFYYNNGLSQEPSAQKGSAPELLVRERC